MQLAFDAIQLVNSDQLIGLALFSGLELSVSRGAIMTSKSLRTAPFLLVLLFLTSCVIQIPIAIPYINKEKYAAKLEPPAQYNHPFNGQVVERVVPEAQVRSLCMSMGADLGGVACSWQSGGACYIV